MNLTYAKPERRGAFGTFSIILLLAIILALPGVQPATAMSNPQFDVTGVWKNQLGQTFQLFQDRDEVHGILVNAGFAHRMEGRYVSPTKIKLILIRRVRSGGCAMTMTVDIVANSANSLLLTSVAAENACGLTAGQSFPDTFTRVL